MVPHRFPHGTRRLPSPSKASHGRAGRPDGEHARPAGLHDLRHSYVAMALDPGVAQRDGKGPYPVCPSSARYAQIR